MKPEAYAVWHVTLRTPPYMLRAMTSRLPGIMLWSVLHVALRFPRGEMPSQAIQSHGTCHGNSQRATSSVPCGAATDQTDAKRQRTHARRLIGQSHPGDALNGHIIHQAHPMSSDPVVLWRTRQAHKSGRMARIDDLYQT